MAMTRVKYGVEFDTRHEDKGSSGNGWIVVLVLLIAAGWFILRVISRISDAPAEGDTPENEKTVIASGGPAADDPGVSESSAPSAPGPALIDSRFTKRSAKVQSLLLRLQSAARKGDLYEQITAIEQIRALQDPSAADLDADLVRQLGSLNYDWLFKQKNEKWVGEVTVKRGDFAERLSRESGSTLGALRRLNPTANLDRLQIGAKLWVLKHPDFSLTVHKRLRAVDLNLGGKLFKRYLLPDSAPPIRMEAGGYRLPDRLRDYFRRQGIGLSADDMTELDDLVPRNTTVIVSPS